MAGKMYCSTCGNNVSPGLSYCNQCGARIGMSEDVKAVPAGSYNLLVAAVIGIPFVGLAMILILIAALKNGMGFRDDFVFGTIFLCFILLAIAEIGCFIMLLTRTKGAKASKTKPADKMREIAGPITRGLPDQSYEPMPIGSVTEHTTRTLDPVERKEK